MRNIVYLNSYIDTVRNSNILYLLKYFIKDDVIINKVIKETILLIDFTRYCRVSK
jgi:hypothetical protein